MVGTYVYAEDMATSGYKANESMCKGITRMGISVHRSP